MHSILILNGPNLNMLGIREPEIYGDETLEDIKARCIDKGNVCGFSVEFRHSNDEGELVTWIQEARGAFNGIIINPAAYGHTSIAIMDALLAVNLPTIEVHLSNIQKRERFRHHSYISKVAFGVIAGFGIQSYELAFDAMVKRLNSVQ